MPDLEAIGDAATGAVLASALEPGIAADDGHTHEKNCSVKLAVDRKQISLRRYHSYMGMFTGAEQE